MPELHFPYLKEIIVFLVSAGVVVPFARRFGVNPVLGFLTIGLVVGPLGLGRLAGDVPLLGYVSIADPEAVRALGELGIVFLLFTIGLDLSLDRLWGLRRYLLGFGLAQILLTGAVIGGAAAAFGNGALAAVILAFAFAVSSTAIVMQILIQRRQTGTILGRAVFGVLLMQDLAVVPMLALVAVAGAGNGAATMVWAVTKGVMAAAAIVVVGRLAVRPAFRWVGAQRSADVFMAATLLIVVVTSVATASLGLSMALGAFLAGLLLSETEYRHEVAVDIEPFRGLLLGLFFMTVGMGIDLVVLAADPLPILAAVAGLYLIKGVVAAGCARLFGLALPIAAEAGFLLGQSGEFAFLIVGLSINQGILAPGVGQFMLIVAGLSMLAAAPVAHLGERAAAWLAARAKRDDAEAIPAQEGHVVVAGHGRVGRMFTRLLDSEAIPYVVFDIDAQAVAAGRRDGKPIYFGDASRPQILRQASPDKAQAVVVTVDDAAAAAHIVQAVKREWPHIPVFARARDSDEARLLLAAGASDVVPEASESSLQLAGRVLAALGTPEDAVTKHLARERDADLARYRRPPGAA